MIYLSEQAYGSARQLKSENRSATEKLAKPNYGAIFFSPILRYKLLHKQRFFIFSP